jgi:hypothetical protein
MTTKTEVVPTVLVKRSVSPDGRIDSLSFELSVPVSDLAVVTETLLDLAVAVDLAGRRWREHQLEPPSPENGKATATNGNGSAKKNGKPHLDSIRATVKWIDQVDSKFSDEKQWRIRFKEDGAPTLYLSPEKFNDAIEAFGLTRPFQLTGQQVCVIVDSEKGKSRWIQPVE